MADDGSRDLDSKHLAFLFYYPLADVGLFNLVSVMLFSLSHR